MIVCGDSANIIPTLADESVDLIVTDPPYGWKFMGKDWDKAVPSVAIWRECLRVLKPGAFAFVMSGPRMDCLSEMGKRLAEAGFETGFTPIFWTFASGFPKAMNIGKAVDKRAGRIGHSVLAIKREIRQRFTNGGLTLKQFNEQCGFEASGYLRESSTWAGVLPSRAKWQAMKQALDCGDELDELFDEAEREIIGKDPQRGNVGYESETYAYKPNERLITTPATPEAQALDGSYAGAQFKPAVEVIIVAMKPKTTKTYIDQALLWHKEREEALQGLAIQLKDCYNIDEVEWEE